MLCIALGFSVPKWWRLTLNLSHQADVIPNPPLFPGGLGTCFLNPTSSAGCPTLVFSEGGDFHVILALASNISPDLSFRPERPVFFLAREASTGRAVEESLFDPSRSHEKLLFRNVA
jgi:hypothetical protein